MSGIIEKIKNIPDVRKGKGCSLAQIMNAQKKLTLTFPADYVDYLKAFGFISFYGTEWTGLNVDGYLNVVQATELERAYNPKFPADCFVLENLAIDDIFIITDEKGVVYGFQGNKKEKVADTISDYLDICCLRKRN